MGTETDDWEAAENMNIDWPVIETHGPRPAGKPNECFYCYRRLGEQHAEECVMRQRPVVVRMTVEYIVAVPESWDAHSIEFHRNDGSWCADNALAELESIGGVLGCLCNLIEYAYVREATAEEAAEQGVDPRKS